MKWHYNDHYNIQKLSGLSFFVCLFLLIDVAFGCGKLLLQKRYAQDEEERQKERERKNKEKWNGGNKNWAIVKCDIKVK